MSPATAPVALLPVLAFLATLFYLDSYKLVRVRAVLAMLACGIAAGGVAYGANGLLIDLLPLGRRAYSFFAAPPVEEMLKALVVLAFIRAHRVGFLVDAAICGFATGAGFALLENLAYLQMFPNAGMGAWILRGFGTALMHGGATAIFAVMGLAMMERGAATRAPAFLPGFVLAVALHAAFNYFLYLPLVSAVGIAVVLPPLFNAVFSRSERAVGAWLGSGFDADVDRLELINSGSLADSPAGRYLTELKDRFDGPVVADILCYMRLHTELALRAKGILLMRENGFEAPIDAETRAKVAEVRYLEGAIGRTGMLALEPMLPAGHKELWQMNLLGK